MINHIDEFLHQELGIFLGWTGGVNKRSVSEQTLCFMLGLCRNLFFSSFPLKKGQWIKDGGLLLTNKCVGIIGCGGISTWQDAVEFILAGASAVQFGSVLGEHWTEVFAEINNGIKNYMEKNGYAKMSEMIGNAKRS